MTITTHRLTAAAGLCAAAAGAIFIGVQVGHPHLDATSIQTTEMAVRGTAKVLMAVLALVGLTGMYLSQVRRNGVIGLVGYLVIGTGYLLITCTAFVAAFVLPNVAALDPAYAAFEENRKGSISVGKMADFLILNRDIMKIPEKEILSALPVATVLGGELVYGKF